MSWDILVFEHDAEKPHDFSENSDDYRPEPLGPSAAVLGAISAHFPGVDLSDPTWGIYDGDGFSIEFNIGNEEPIESVMLHVRGEDDPVPSLVKFALANDWSLFDLSTGEFMDLENPSRESWQRFKELRNKLAERFGEDAT